MSTLRTLRLLLVVAALVGPRAAQGQFSAAFTLTGDAADSANVFPLTPLTVTVTDTQGYGTTIYDNTISRTQLNWMNSSAGLGLTTGSTWTWGAVLAGLIDYVDVDMSDGIVGRINAGDGIVPGTFFSVGTLTLAAPAYNTGGGNTHTLNLTGGSYDDETLTVVACGSPSPVPGEPGGVQLLAPPNGTGLTLSTYSFMVVPGGKWTGGAGTTWQSCGNWSSAMTPDAAFSAVFEGSPTANQPILAAGGAVKGITFKSAGWTISDGGNAQTRDRETGWYYKNGGQSLWGYRSERLTRGMDKRDRPVMKSIWVLDETVVSGRPVHEWVRHCLLELAGKGASLDELRDFCNEHGLPGRRKEYWGTSTWNALLQPHVLLEYCGYGVWNVHGKHGRERPASEWVVVPNAHPAIITEEEAKAIAAARRQRREENRRFDGGCRRSQTSSYLLSGGLFKCGRCGSNMIGFRTSKGHYYVCGSQPYRRGKGCGAGVYVPQEEVEAEVVRGLEGMMAVCLDPKGFTRRVNEELRRLWAESTNHNPQAAEQLKQVETKVAHIRRAIEDGLGDAQWANGRLGELAADRERLAGHAAASTRPPQIDVGMVMAYREQVGRLFAHGKPVEKKQLLRKCVEEMKLAPERLEVDITYRVPEPVMNSVVAGAGFEPATFGL